MISIVLRVHRFEIVEAASGEEGLKAFEDSKFDLAIVDIFLHGTNGLDVIRMMRERVENLPIIAMSGMTALDFVSATPELPNVVCLQKPFRPSELIACDRSGVCALAATGRHNRARTLAPEQCLTACRIPVAQVTNKKTPRRTGALNVAKKFIRPYEPFGLISA